MTQPRKTPIEIERTEFAEIGHQLIDSIAGFLDSIRDRPVTPAEKPGYLQAILGNRSLPDEGTPASELLSRAAELVIEHHLLRSTPRGAGRFAGICGQSECGRKCIESHSLYAICKAYDLWFHIDGAYGIPAAALPDYKGLFAGIEMADSIALDPHKWLYSPLEVGCTLVKNPGHLVDTYSSHPEYYNFDTGEDDQVVNYYEHGLQNSRGFRALKVWLTLQQAGRNGYINMISEDIRLARLLFDLADRHPLLEAVTQSLSITTFRFIPSGYSRDPGDKEYLNVLNEALLNALQKGGEVFLSNAVIDEKYCLRACIVNFRTPEKDIEEIIEIVVRKGESLHREIL